MSDDVAELAALLRDTAPAVDGLDPDTTRLVTDQEFAAVDEPGAAAIVGTPESPLIPEGGNVMIYGDGGVGKTTLCVDLAYHLAAGDDWLRLTVGRPLRVLIVENEGPRPLFRGKIRRKRAGWGGSDPGDRLLILEHPWARFTFADPGWRSELAELVAGREIDVVIVGPLASSGMDTAGTLQDVRAFTALVDDVRYQARRPIAIVLVHHENKGGRVSGAWEGAGDTLIHVMGQGHGKLRVFFQKARWASDLHATGVQLEWAAGDTFAVTDPEPDRPERTWVDIETFVLEHGGTGWNAVTEAVSGSKQYLQRRRDSMLEEGLIVNAGSRSGFELWHRDDPARPAIYTSGSDGGTAAEPLGSDTGAGGVSGSGSAVPPFKGEPLAEPPGPAAPGGTGTEPLAGAGRESSGR